MHGLIRWLRESERVQSLQRSLKARAKLQVQGGFSSSWAAILAAILYDRQHPTLILVPSAERLPNFVADLETLIAQPDRIYPFPPHPALLSGDTDLAVTRDRIAAVDALHRKRNAIVVATPTAICQPTVSLSVYEQSALLIKVGATIERDDLVAHLVSGGYERVPQVEAPGQFAVRGDIVDFFSPAHDQPIRIELFGDEVESIRPFDIETQRSTGQWRECVILPAREFILRDTGHGAQDKTERGAGRGTRDGDFEGRIREMLEREVERLQKDGKPEQARLLRQQVEHDLERLFMGSAKASPSPFSMSSSVSSLVPRPSSHASVSRVPCPVSHSTKGGFGGRSKSPDSINSATIFCHRSSRATASASRSFGSSQTTSVSAGRWSTGVGSGS